MSFPTAPNLACLPAEILEFKILKNLAPIYCISLAFVCKRLNRIAKRVLSIKNSNITKAPANQILSPAIKMGAFSLVVWAVECLHYGKENPESATETLVAAAAGELGVIIKK